MASKNYRFSGEVIWAKVYADQIDRTFADPTDPKDKGGKWSIGLTVDDETLEIYKSWKTKNKIDGNTIYFVRREFADYGNGLEDNGPPKVRLPKGTKEGALIGNGSKADLIINQYSFRQGRGIATRLDEVIVTDLVELTRKEVEDIKSLRPSVSDELPVD